MVTTFIIFCLAPILPSVSVSATDTPGAGITQSWVYDTPNAIHSVPLVISQTNDSPFMVVTPTSADARIWMLSKSAALLGTLSSDRAIEGPIAGTGRPGQLVYEDVTGQVTFQDMKTNAVLTATPGDRPVRGGGLCITDLDADGEPEILRASREGRVTAFDLAMTPQWQYDAGSPILRAPACGPVFAQGAAIYLYCADGTIHALTGEGLPLWRLKTNRLDPEDCPGDGPLLVQLHREFPVLIFTDLTGGLSAVNAVTGELVWRAQVGNGDLGTPAIIDAPEPHKRQIVTVSNKGAVTVTDADGNPIQQGQLPKGDYVPRPLVADTDGDGQPELIVMDQNWGIIIASLAGTIKQQIELRGNALAGAILEDLDQNGMLELLVTTDCARIHCFATHAVAGWTHPRANGMLNGYVPAITRQKLPPFEETPRHVRLETAIIPDFAPQAPYATVCARVSPPAGAHRVIAHIRCEGVTVGGGVVAMHGNIFNVPCVRSTEAPLEMDARFIDRSGKLLAVSLDNPVRTGSVQLVALPSIDKFLRTIDEQAATYTFPETWRPPEIEARTTWHLITYQPDQWNAWGLAQDPFIAEAMPYIGNGIPDGTSHPAWNPVVAGKRPFIIAASQDPQWSCPIQTYETIRAAAAARFLGFYQPNLDRERHEQGIHFSALLPPPQERIHALWKTRISEFSTRTAGAFIEGQINTLFHHQAFEWGADAAVGQIGNPGICASLQYAFLRGASRQYNTKPWGIEIRNTFEDTQADGRLRPDGSSVCWTRPGRAQGLNCGHSPNLESRFEITAQLAGTSFIHHEQESAFSNKAFADTSPPPSIFVRETQPGVYVPSPFAAAMKTWYDFATHFPDRGTAYTPIAFVLNFEHNWQPLQEYWGEDEANRGNRATGAILRHVFAMEPAGDLERGFLTNGPYGDIFDVVTDNAKAKTFAAYGVLWPLGTAFRDEAKRTAAMEYVAQGGILILDAATATAFPEKFLGMRIKPGVSVGTQIQTPLTLNTALTGAPYYYRDLAVEKKTDILAWSDNGSALMAWRRHGRGIVITCASEDWLDTRGHLLPLAPGLLRTFADAFLPTVGSANAQLLFNRTGDGWIIGLINNNGVKKSPTQAATVDTTETSDCVLKFKNDIPLQFSPRFGQFQWDSAANGLSARLQPGEIAVVKAVTGR